MELYKIIFLLGLLILAIYELFLRPMACKQKIYKHVKSLKGTVISIKNISRKDEIYLVQYKAYGKSIKATVKFDFFYRAEWR